MPKKINYNDRRRRETEKKAERALKWRDRGFTLEQISGKLGVSSSRVSQLLAEAQ